MTDYAQRRTFMVDTQIRPSDVTKFPIIDAMLSVPREVYTPRDKREAAYVGENIEFAPGRVMLEPRTLAKMLDGLAISGGELVLDIGAGYGYAAAVMARMAEAVVAVEDDADRVSEAQGALSDHGADGVIMHEAALDAGAPEHGPYDVIVIEGGIEHLPEAIADQLKDGGRIAALFMEGALGTVRLGYKQNGAISWRFAFNAAAPVLPLKSVSVTLSVRVPSTRPSTTTAGPCGQATARAEVNHAARSSEPISSSRCSTLAMAWEKSLSGPPQRAEKMPGAPSRARTDRPESSANATSPEASAA